MRIAFIGQKGIPNRSGGVEKHVEDLAVRLVENGHEVLVYTRPNYTDKNLTNYKGVQLISLPSIATKNLDAISHTFFACLDLLRRKVDVIHFHAIGPSSLIWLVKILKPRTPIVFTFHCQDYYHQKWGLMARTYLKLGEFVGCHLADKIIVISKSLVDYVKEKYKKEPVFIPNGVNLPVLNEADTELKKFNLEKNGYIVAISRLIRHKGLAYLIKAYQQLETDKKLVIVGDGAFTDDYVQELHALAAGNKNIIFTGAQSGDALVQLFTHAYLFVQPSESEGLSIALLEAMSYRKACLVSDIKENLDVINEAGVSFKNKEPEDLARQLKMLLGDQELVNKYGELARQEIETTYNWHGLDKNVIKVYNNLLK